MEEKDKVQNEESKAQGSSKFEHFFDGGRHDHESIKKVRTSFRVETATCVKLAIAVFAVYLSIRYWPQVAKFIMGVIDSAEPLIIGAIVAFLVNILMRSLEKVIFAKAKKPALITARRIICMLWAFILLIGIVALIVWLITPQLVSCIELIIAEVPPLFNSIIKWLQTTEFLPDDILAELASIDWKSNLTKIFDVLTSGIGSVFDIVVSTVTSVFSGVVTALVSLIFAIYILLDKERLAKQFKRLEKCYLGLSKRRKYNHTLQTIKDSFEKFIVGQCKEAVILGVLCAVGMWIFRFPYASMIGALIGFTALIPVAGAYIGAAVGAIMILTESPFKALLFIVFIVVLQQLEGNLIYPKVVGESIGLPGLWVLAAVTIGGGVMGIPGMLIGVPLVAAIYKLVGEDMDERFAAREAASVPAPAEPPAPIPEEPQPVPVKVEEPIKAPKPKKKNKKKKK
ncbi:MAG: AI-2E family transporter [Clostridia bacterium]|nr:AI-2E family transporter [Clostridia bacterium]